MGFRMEVGCEFQNGSGLCVLGRKWVVSFRMEVGCEFQNGSGLCVLERKWVVVLFNSFL